MKKHKHLNILATLIVLASMALSAIHTQTAKAAPPGGTTPTIWVNDTGDLPDADGVAPCDTGTGILPTGRQPCTLRAAIQVANARAGADAIAFEFCREDSMTAGDAVDSYMIAPASPLPAITDGLTYINGYTQGYPSATPGYDDLGIVGSCTAPLLATPNTNSFSLAMNTVLAVEIDGSACVSPVPQFDPDQTTPVSGGVVPSGSIIHWNSAPGACSGFTLTSDRNVVAGLNIRNWRNAGILIMPLTYGQANKPSENSVWGDFIGTNIAGSIGQANRFGVEIIGKSDANYIGDTMAIPTWGVSDSRWAEEPTNNERNLISGNNNPNFVYGYNCAEGGFYTNFWDDGAGVFMGVDPCIRRNGPQGATQASIFIGGAVDNHVRNSYIGTDYQGIAPIPNSVGVWLNYDAGRDGSIPGNHIGGCLVLPFTPGTNAACLPQTDREQDPNLISGNHRVVGGGAQQTLGGHGIWLNGLTSQSTQRDGAYDVSYNEIGGNFIGTNASGIDKLPNGGNGVFILANSSSDVQNGPDHNEIGATTVWVPGTQIPYRAPYAGLQPYRFGNVISGNGDPNDLDNTFGRWDNGVEIRGATANFNYVGYGNAIGLNSQGMNTPVDVGNGENGVFITSGADDNYIYNNSGASISVPFPAAPNDLVSTFGAISDNGDFPTAQGRNGVRIANSAYHNHIFRNCIGGDAVDTPGGSLDDCDGADGNHFAGISMVGGAVHNWVGLYQWTGNDAADNQGNWIHNNGTDGVQVVDTGTAGTAIRYNRIWRNGAIGNVPVDGNLGIDLVDDNDTPNDVGDLDGSSNLQQNYPDNRVMTYPWLISFTQPDGCTDPNCVIDIYATLVSESDWTNYPDVSDPQITNNGEGRYWLTSVVGSATNLDISAEVTAAFGGPPPENVCISLTTTRSDEDIDPIISEGYRNTSEFSPCLGFTPTAATLIDLRAHTNGTLPALALAGFALLTVCAAGLFTWRRRSSAR